MASKNGRLPSLPDHEPEQPDRELLAFRSASFIAQLLQIPLVTANRWKRLRQVPPMARRLLDILANGNLEKLDAKWKGWAITKGDLVSPENEIFTPGNVRAGRYWRDAAQNHNDSLATLRAEVQAMRALLDQARADLDAAQRDYEKLVNAAPVRVQLVAIDGHGNQTPLTAAVVPIVRARMPALQDQAGAA